MAAAPGPTYNFVISRPENIEDKAFNIVSGKYTQIYIDVAPEDQINGEQQVFGNQAYNDLKHQIWYFERVPDEFVTIKGDQGPLINLAYFIKNVETGLYLRHDSESRSFTVSSSPTPLWVLEPGVNWLVRDHPQLKFLISTDPYVTDTRDDWFRDRPIDVLAANDGTPGKPLDVEKDIPYSDHRSNSVTENTGIYWGMNERDDITLEDLALAEKRRLAHIRLQAALKIPEGKYVMEKNTVEMLKKAVGCTKATVWARVAGGLECQGCEHHLTDAQAMAVGRSLQ